MASERIEMKDFISSPDIGPRVAGKQELFEEVFADPQLYHILGSGNETATANYLRHVHGLSAVEVGEIMDRLKNRQANNSL